MTDDILYHNLWKADKSTCQHSFTIIELSDVVVLYCTSCHTYYSVSTDDFNEIISIWYNAYTYD